MNEAELKAKLVKSKTFGDMQYDREEVIFKRFDKAKNQGLIFDGLMVNTLGELVFNNESVEYTFKELTIIDFTIFSLGMRLVYNSLSNTGYFVYSNGTGKNASENEVKRFRMIFEILRKDNGESELEKWGRVRDEEFLKRAKRVMQVGVKCGK